MINESIIKNITNINDFIEISHTNLIMPFLIILYISFIIFLLLSGIIVLKGKLSGKFWSIYILSSILSGGILLLLYLAPHTILKLLNFIIS